MNDFNLRFDKELGLAEQAAGQLTPTWKAHLYLKKLLVPEDKESLILTGALGKYTFEALRASAMSSFPSAHSLGYKNRTSFKEKDTRRSLARIRFQKRGFQNGRKRSYRASEARNESGSGASESDSGQSETDNGSASQPPSGSGEDD